MPENNPQVHPDDSSEPRHKPSVINISVQNAITIVTIIVGIAMFLGGLEYAIKDVEKDVVTVKEDIKKVRKSINNIDDKLDKVIDEITFRSGNIADNE